MDFAVDGFGSVEAPVRDHQLPVDPDMRPAVLGSKFCVVHFRVIGFGFRASGFGFRLCICASCRHGIKVRGGFVTSCLKLIGRVLEFREHMALIKTESASFMSAILLPFPAVHQQCEAQKGRFSRAMQGRT